VRTEEWGIEGEVRSERGGKERREWRGKDEIWR